MKPDISNLLKQAQKMQSQMQEAQKELADMVVIGEAGGGLIRVEMTGRHNCKKTHFDNSLFDEDKEIIEDLITAAINNAVEKIEKTSRDKLSKLTSGIQLPTGLGDLAG
jgi:DNA-binding YbaB/EbfC family protein